MFHTFPILTFDRMESRSLVFLLLVLLSPLVFAEEAHARTQITDEDYWKAVWPNMAIPKPLRELLKPDAGKYDQHMKHNDACSTIYFFNNEIYPGKTMAINGVELGTWSYLPWAGGGDKSTGYTREELCVQKGSSIEDKNCADSLKTLMDYVISKYGKNVKPLLSSFLVKQDQYRVEGVTNIGQKAVMCHQMNFQKVTFYCHEIHGTTLYSVSLVAGDGTKTQALAVCHFDTSGMNKKMLRQAMKVDPGTKPVCHFLGNNEVVWVPY